MTKQEMIEKIKILYGESLYEENKDGYHDYERELGVFVMHTLLESNTDVIVEHRADMLSLCVGYPVRINHRDPERIELWRKVKL